MKRLFACSVLLTLCASGCSSPPSVEVHFAEYAPFAQGGLSSDVILPPLPGERFPLLRLGWATSSDAESQGGYWVYGHDAEARFFHVAEGEAALELRGAPFSPPGAPTQVLSVYLNGEAIQLVPMPAGWDTYRIPLPEHRDE